MKEKIRPIYGELQGYLSEAPNKNSHIYEETVWNRYNETLTELNSVSERNYDGYKVNPKRFGMTGADCVGAMDYRTKLAGLISRLHAEFFADERQPLSGMPSTIINQTQSQNQEQQQSAIVDIAMIIAEKRIEYKEESPERNFLDQLGDVLKKTKDIKDIISNIINLATATGVDIGFLKKIFGG